MPDDAPETPPSPPGAGPTENPYAPPRAKLLPPPAPTPELTLTPLPGEPFSANRVILRAWEIYKEQFWVVFWLVNVPVFVGFLYNLVGEAMSASVDQESTMGQLAQLMFRLAYVVLGVWLQSGTTLGLVRLARGESAQVGDIFQGGPYVLRMVGASLLFSLLVIATAALCLAPVWLFVRADNALGAVAAFLVGGVVAAVLILLCTARLYQFYYLVIDRGAGAFESLRRSFTLTRGHTLEVAGLLIIGVMVNIAGLMACLVGALFTSPWVMLLGACVYTGLKAEKYREFGDDGAEYLDGEEPMSDPGPA